MLLTTSICASTRPFSQGHFVTAPKQLLSSRHCSHALVFHTVAPKSTKDNDDVPFAFLFLDCPSSSLTLCFELRFPFLLDLCFLSSSGWKLPRFEKISIEGRYLCMHHLISFYVAALSLPKSIIRFIRDHCYVSTQRRTCGSRAATDAKLVAFCVVRVLATRPAAAAAASLRLTCTGDKFQ